MVMDIMIIIGEMFHFKNYLMIGFGLEARLDPTQLLDLNLILYQKEVDIQFLVYT